MNQSKRKNKSKTKSSKSLGNGPLMLGNNSTNGPISYIGMNCPELSGWQQLRKIKKSYYQQDENDAKEFLSISKSNKDLAHLKSQSNEVNEVYNNTQKEEKAQRPRRISILSKQSDKSQDHEGGTKIIKELSMADLKKEVMNTYSDMADQTKKTVLKLDHKPV